MDEVKTSELSVIGHYSTWHHIAQYLNLQHGGFYMHKTASPKLPDDAALRQPYVIQGRDKLINKKIFHLLKLRYRPYSMLPHFSGT